MEMNQTQENKILMAAIQCINESGLEGTTIRRIADIAGVNSAAISYYFRSKDKLVEMAMEITLQNGFDWGNIPNKEGETVKERVISVFSTLLEGLRQFPGIARAHFHELFVSGNYNSPVVGKLNGFLETLTAELKTMDPTLDEGMLKPALMIITSAALIQPALLPSLYESFYPSIIDTEEHRMLYLENLVNKFF